MIILAYNISNIKKNNFWSQLKTVTQLLLKEHCVQGLKKKNPPKLLACRHVCFLVLRGKKGLPFRSLWIYLALPTYVTCVRV
uniref:Uncharacterized protein n=1 Tax=Anguilla anguilla TaxID=7936 RepID=A0A0E9WZD2_ANGAN